MYLDIVTCLAQEGIITARKILNYPTNYYYNIKIKQGNLEQKLPFISATFTSSESRITLKVSS